MNVNDFEAPPTPADWPTALGLIFARQRDLMEKYKTIEGLPDPPLSLHHAHGQKILKDFAWRVTEELAESWEAYKKSEAASNSDLGFDEEIKSHLEHMFEELADALHFMVELLIFAGIGSTSALEYDPAEPRESVTRHGQGEMLDCYWQVVYELGIAMNFLRNKPWKQSQVPTDEARFRAQLLKAFHTLKNLFADVGLTWEEAFAFYFRKSEVNKFRQRSQY